HSARTLDQDEAPVLYSALHPALPVSSVTSILRESANANPGSRQKNFHSGCEHIPTQRETRAAEILNCRTPTSVLSHGPKRPEWTRTAGNRNDEEDLGPDYSTRRDRSHKP